jgi:hypothetical protein
MSETDLEDLYTDLATGDKHLRTTYQLRRDQKYGRHMRAVLRQKKPKWKDQLNQSNRRRKPPITLAERA